MDKLKTHDVILIVLFGLMFAFGVSSYLVVPKDPETVKVIVHSFEEAISMVLSFKFGIHQAQVQAGTMQATLTGITTPTKEDLSADVKHAS